MNWSVPEAWFRSMLRLKEAMDIIYKDCGERAVEMLKYNAECVFAGKDIYPAKPVKPKRIMGRWM